MAVSTYNNPFSGGAGATLVARGTPNAQTFSTTTHNIRRHKELNEHDKRQGHRRPLRCEMMLIDDLMEDGQPSRVIPAECLNVGEWGVYGIVPIGYGVVKGQRYTVRLVIGERGPEPGLLQVVCQQGRVVRTDLLLGESGRPDRVGLGVKLVGHRQGTIPMPLTM